MKTRSTAPMRVAKTGYIVISIIMGIVGILFMALPDAAVVWLSIVSGVAMIVFGVIKIIGYISKDLYRLAFQFDLELGIISIVLGVVILVRNDSFMRLICVILGLAILIDGLFKIRISQDARRFGIGKWWLILVSAAAACVIGAFMVIFPKEGSIALSIWIGLSLLIEGVMNLVAAICTVKIVKNQKPDVIDVEYEDVSGEREEYR